MSVQPGNEVAFDLAACIGCGKCSGDCAPGIISMDGGKPRIQPDVAERCIVCQHCLAICPVGAVSVNGLKPAVSSGVGRGDFDALEAQIKRRRSIRAFSSEPVDRATLDELLAVTAYAPTGSNVRERRFAVVLDPAVMAELRDRTARILVEKAETLPEDVSWLVGAARVWLDEGRDVIFRTAPHLIVVSVGPGASCPAEDAVIALTHFDLLAQSRGIGTTWCGMFYRVLRYVPEARDWLGIPADYDIGYAMLFGRSAVSYARTAQYAPENVAIIDKL